MMKRIGKKSGAASKWVIIFMTALKPYLIDVQFSTDKKLATTQDRQALQNSDEKQYCQYWTLPGA